MMLEQRRCSDCGVWKPLRTDFHKATRTAYRRQCKPCWRKRERQRWKQWYAAATPEQRMNAPHRWLAKGNNRSRIRMAWRAAYLLRQAIAKGLINRPSTCEQCAKPCKPDGAHYDYDQPLYVRWLCRSCHVLWDRSVPKSRGVIDPNLVARRSRA